MVIVNTVVLVQSRFALPQSSTALALAAFGGGSMVAALVLPRLLKNIKDRTAMLFGGGILVAGLAVGINLTTYNFLLPLWMVLGVGYSLAQTRAVDCCVARHMPKIARRCLPPNLRCPMLAG
jgi:fucose permease